MFLSSALDYYYYSAGDSQQETCTLDGRGGCILNRWFWKAQTELNWATETFKTRQCVVFLPSSRFGQCAWTAVPLTFSELKVVTLTVCVSLSTSSFWNNLFLCDLSSPSPSSCRGWTLAGCLGHSYGPCCSLERLLVQCAVGKCYWRCWWMYFAVCKRFKLKSDSWPCFS